MAREKAWNLVYGHSIKDCNKLTALLQATPQGRAAWEMKIEHHVGLKPSAAARVLPCRAAQAMGRDIYSVRVFNYY